ncbi:MAG: sodium/proline symporter [Verrucomicrobia bacterium]|nr:sodium/proline symporter [Verrucomicrobiota bacterium]
MTEFLAICIYFSFLIGFAIAKQKRALTQRDFVIGNRSLSRWTTALAAHASDMSNWLFMAYPGMVFLIGGQQIWVAIGLLLMMWVNWRVVAPRVRRETEKTSSVTITGFFEQKLGQNWPIGRLVTSIFLFLFYTIYVAVTLYGMGLLVKTLFPVSYATAIILGVTLILPYVLIGGYLTLAQVDLFQGLFLLSVILFVPLYIGADFGGVGAVIEAVQTHGRSFNLLESNSPGSIWNSVLLMLGWGIGYFGQPHILTKFMGIKDPRQIKGACRIGMTWHFLSLLGATLIGFVGIAVFGGVLSDREQVFIELVHNYFPPFISGIFLCAIIATIINSVGSMLLVLSTTITEDIYKRFFRNNCSEKESLRVTRIASAFSALIAMGIALSKVATIDELVMYAWSGLGASFGPLMIATLYFRRLTSTAAWVGMVVGGGTVAIWPLIGLKVPPLIVAFPLALVAIYFASRLRSQVVVKNELGP